MMFDQRSIGRNTGPSVIRETVSQAWSARTAQVSPCSHQRPGGLGIGLRATDREHHSFGFESHIPHLQRDQFAAPQSRGEADRQERAIAEAAHCIRQTTDQAAEQLGR
jgi:hypothetical protein